VWHRQHLELLDGKLVILGSGGLKGRARLLLVVVVVVVVTLALLGRALRLARRLDGRGGGLRAPPRELGAGRKTVRPTR